jgi:UDP-N-acetylmuramoyl-tripeptide--D-alanyl-D-alanine ligase
MTEVRYSTDTRALQPGDTFVAIPGERYDGHDFILEAIERGAVGLVVERDVSRLSIPSHVCVTWVDDSIHYLANEASKRIRRLKPDVIAVTGSVGKTTTKDAIATVLSQVMPVVAPRGNLNTLLGLSLTILNALSKEEQKLVIEVGAYQKGDIACTCSFIPPTISVVTNVSPVHLERMQTMANIAAAKSELVEALPASGVACLNWDDHRVRAMASYCKGKVLYYGQYSGADVGPECITADIPLLGAYKIYVALAAFCVGHCLGLSSDAINQGLAKLAAPKGRLSILPGIGGITIIDDTYNASLVSTLAALEVLGKMATKHRIAFLGDMLELGEEEEASHREIVRLASEITDQAVLVGPRMALAAHQANLEQGRQISTFAQSTDVVEALRAGQVYQPRSGDWVLVKGSASVRMERIVKQLLDPGTKASSALVRQDASWSSI